MLALNLAKAARVALSGPKYRMMAMRAYGGHELTPTDNPHWPGYPKGREPGHMDDVPVPQGPWKESYEKYQAKYNKQLAFGLAFFAGTVYYIWWGEAIDFVLAPPMKNPK
ncbi:hypothetical protein HDE_13343 [Halotydeus destructor]|nr:hypothetical protein HDE_13343 [Halotydeus destructor]